MRKIENIITVIVLSFTLLSCGSWLEVEPQNDITLDDFWKSKEDIRSALTSGYNQIRDEAPTMLVWGEVRADMVADGPGNHGDFEKVMRLEILPGNSINQWLGMYKIINYANTVIKYAPTVRKSDLSLGVRDLNSFLAEAKFQRALAYFYLVRTFRDVPLYLEPVDTDNVDIFLPKSDEADILAQIIEDLEWAERYAPRGFSEVEYNKGFGTKAVIQALLADVYLWDGQFDNCVTMCNKIIDRSAYRILDSESFGEIFGRGNTNEGILELQFDATKNQKNKFWNLYSTGGKNGLAFIVPPHVEEAYDESDKRKLTTVYRNSKDVLMVNKFDVFGNSISEDANWIVYRYADILLMKAEALVNTGDYFGAQNELNIIRDRAGLGPKILSENRFEAEDAILAERGLEFAYEGKRWFDLLRVARRNNFERKETLINILTRNIDPAKAPKYRSLLSDPMSYYLPIWQKELENNVNLVQNPYYE
ncbi:membrane protein (plasmid) [Fulvitalea axinellae]|uniref:Membrane protein n=1 Tax=Fulvitalea axinellae TaxID=1182444 RepID=A0AAU9CTZ5_9BACT|nr:membrane protein [Fulvitalea axinellae]